MRTIYKFPLVIGEVNKVRVPDGSVVRMVANQRGNVTLWIEVDPHANTVERHYVIFGTGSPIDAGACYVGSCIVDPYVWYCPVCEWAGGMFYAVQAPATAELIGLQKRITARFHRAQNKVLPTTAYRRDCDKCDSGRGEYHCRHADADELRADEVGRRWLKNMVGAYKLQGKFST